MTRRGVSRRRFLAAAAGGAAPRKTPRLEGTFLQLAGALADWDSRQWGEAFGYFRALGLREFVVQWSAVDGRDLVENVREIAGHVAKTRGELWLGLVYEAEYWQRIQGSDAALADYFGGLAERSVALAQKLKAAVPKAHGWYVPQELDDVNWSTPGRMDLLSGFLRRVAPRGRVAISAFGTAAQNAGRLPALCRRIARETPVKFLFLQDGVGTGQATVETAAELRAALRRSGVKLRSVVELFEQTSAPGESFAARPAPLVRIERQLLAAGPEALAFSVPEYLSPLGGAEAHRLFESAVERWRRR